MKKIVYGLLLILAFVSGYFSRIPKIIVETKNITEKIYALPDNVDFGTLCQNYLGKQEMDRIETYYQGYERATAK